MSTRPADTVAAALAEGAVQQGGDAFLVVETAPGARQTISWAEMDVRASRTARLLRALGLRPGDRLNVHTTNCAEFYDLWFGAARLGAALVPSDPVHSPDELAYVLGRSRCHLSVVHSGLRDVAVRALAQARDCRHLLVIGGEGDDAFHTARDAQSGAPWSSAVEGAGPSPDEVLGVLEVPGSSGRPGEVTVSHAGYLDAGRRIAARLRMCPEDRQLITLPLFRGNAQQDASMAALVSGGSIALAPGFAAERWPAQARELGASLATLLPSNVCLLLARAPSAHDSAHGLRAVVATQRVAQERVTAFEKRFQVSLLRLYGLRETVAPVPAASPARRRRRERGASSPRPPGESGRPRPDGSPPPGFGRVGRSSAERPRLGRRPLGVRQVCSLREVPPVGCRRWGVPVAVIGAERAEAV